jgi:mannose-1-phosphate guanylyltransferase
MMFVPVILAGGSGERFWPLSRRARPKQFLALDGTGRSLLQATMDRLQPLADPEQIFIVTGQAHRGLILEQLPELPLESLVVEPESRNTAAAVLLAALRVRERFGENSIMGVFASDHRIEHAHAFQDVISAALHVLETENAIITLGIKPTHAATGYGYIHAGSALNSNARTVNAFVEKPDLQTAEAYLMSGQYYWNAGMFLFRTSTILEEFRQHAPDLLDALEPHHHARAELAQAFTSLRKISIDYAILEKSSRVLVIPADFGWDDLGDWNALERLLKTSNPNVEVGQHMGLDTSGALLYTTTGDDLIVTIGLEDVVIVRDGECTLIARKNRTQDIRKLVERMKTHPQLKRYV